jgi:hypothetical protein
MARNHGEFKAHGIEFTVVLVNITAAQAASFNSHDGIVAIGMRDFEILHFIFSGANLNRRSRSRHCFSPWQQPAWTVNQKADAAKI